MPSQWKAGWRHWKNHTLLKLSLLIALVCRECHNCRDFFQVRRHCDVHTMLAQLFRLPQRSEALANQRLAPGTTGASTESPCFRVDRRPCGPILSSPVEKRMFLTWFLHGQYHTFLFQLMPCQKLFLTTLTLHGVRVVPLDDKVEDLVVVGVLDFSCCSCLVEY